MEPGRLVDKGERRRRRRVHGASLRRQIQSSRCRRGARQSRSGSVWLFDTSMQQRLHCLMALIHDNRGEPVPESVDGRNTSPPFPLRRYAFDEQWRNWVLFGAQGQKSNQVR